MMGRLTQLAATLYPRWWRERYGEEFAALLEDARPGLGGTFDVMKGALTMQLTSSSSMRTVLLCAVAGMIVALGATFFMTPQYSSSAVIMIRPQQDPASVTSGVTRVDVDRINILSNTVFSRSELASLIRNLDLYRSERSKMPVEDVLLLMKQNIRVSAGPVLVGGRSVPAFQVSFTYPEAEVAPKVVTSLVSRYLDVNIESRQVQPGGVETLEVLDPASKPLTPVFPNRTTIAAAGLGSGLLLGGMIAMALYFRRKLQPAGEEFATLPGDAGPGPTTEQATSKTVSPVWKASLMGAAAGTLLGLGVAYSITSQYASTAVIRIDGSQPAEPIINRLSQQTFSRQTLSDLIRGLNLYPVERTRMPIEDLLELMKQNIRVTAAPGPVFVKGQRISAFVLRFTYPDRFVAQKVAGYLVSHLLEEKLPQPATTVLIDAPSLPGTPIYPNRLAITLAGLGTGTLLGAIAALLRRRQRQAA